ncbi:MAG: DNA translocase FtsK [Pikeienuella sp.]
MSSWTDDDKDPLLPPAARAFLARRGAELTGLGFALVGGALMATLLSYHPSDPSWFNATSSSARNWLGAPGALLADPMIRSMGLAAFAAPMVLMVWAIRLIAHRGASRMGFRLPVAPFAIVVCTVFASAHSPIPGWPLDTGLGGMLGDLLLAVLFEAIPADPTELLIPLTLGLAFLMALTGAVALGVNWGEFRRAMRFLTRSLIAVIVGLTIALARFSVWLWTRISTALARPRSKKVAPPKPLGLRRSEPAMDSDIDLYDEDDADPYEPPVAAEPADEEPEAQPSASVLPRILSRATERLSEERPVVERAPSDRPPVERPAPKVLPKSKKAVAEEQPMFELGQDRSDDFDLPPLNLLQSMREIVRHTESDASLEENARMLESVLDDYGVRGEIGAVRPGPVVTMYELEPAPGLKASRVIGLADDIARSMSALAARVSTIPGRNVIGIELPNAKREMVLLREMLASKIYGDSSYKLALALGKDIGGEPMIANLAKMPHLLIAGTTGSGKSVAVNTMILSLLYRLSPKECKLIMIDPKMLELSVYDGIPHLLSPVVTDPKKAVVALKWAVAEMEDRYRKMSKMGVRNIDGYNGRVRDALAKGEAFSRTVQTGFDESTGQPIIETEEFEPEEMPFIVVIVEMADLMMVAGKEIEACIQRLAQMARASGIHIIMATQRPSVDVITGTIKANFPTRISFQVTSKIDSRTILGEQGAEQLLGMGDMLYMAGGGRVTRVHGPFVSDEEVEEVVRHLKAQGEPEYVSAVTEGDEDSESAAAIDEILGLGGDGGEDAQYDQAVMIVARDRKCSTSYIQRKLAIGYNKAARIVEQMEDQGVVSPANKVGKREVLIEER